jgi:hypothetical protein
MEHSGQSGKRPGPAQKYIKSTILRWPPHGYIVGTYLEVLYLNQRLMSKLFAGFYGFLHTKSAF